MKPEAAAASRSMVMAPMTRFAPARSAAAPSSARVLQVKRSRAQLSLFEPPITRR